jgi:hypothetical protein
MNSNWEGNEMPSNRERAEFAAAYRKRHGHDPDPHDPTVPSWAEPRAKTDPLATAILWISITLTLGLVAWGIISTHSYSEADKAIMQSCRDRGKTPVVMHDTDGKVLAISCN